MSCLSDVRSYFGFNLNSAVILFLPESSSVEPGRRFGPRQETGPGDEAAVGASGELPAANSFDLASRV